MAALFMLGAATSAGVMYGFMIKPTPATVQAAPAPTPPIVVQLVQPAPATTPPPTAPAGTPSDPGTAESQAPTTMAGPTQVATTSGPSTPATNSAAATTTPVPAASVPPAVTIVQTVPEKPAATKPEITRPANTHTLINLNTATQAELESLPLVGPSMAKRIIEHRTKNGPFKQTKDLDKVKGVGEKTLAKLLPLVTVDSGR
jgi:competence protein ComEA